MEEDRYQLQTTSHHPFTAVYQNRNQAEEKRNGYRGMSILMMTGNPSPHEESTPSRCLTTSNAMDYAYKDCSGLRSESNSSTGIAADAAVSPRMGWVWKEEAHSSGQRDIHCYLHCYDFH